MIKCPDDYEPLITIVLGYPQEKQSMPAAIMKKLVGSRKKKLEEISGFEEFGK